MLCPCAIEPVTLAPVFTEVCMFGKTNELEKRYLELESRLVSPEVLRDQKTYQRVAKEHSTLTPIVTLIRRCQTVSGPNR